MTDNAWCAALGISPPSLAVTLRHAHRLDEAVVVAALLERGTPMTLDEIAHAIAALASVDEPLTGDLLRALRLDAPAFVRDGERYGVDPAAPELRALVERLEVVALPTAARRPALAEVRRRVAEVEQQQAARTRQLAALRRVLVHAYPVAAPERIVVADFESREVRSYGAGDTGAARADLERFDVVVGIEVAAVLAGLGLDLNGRALAELQPHQKTVTTGQRRKVRVSLARLLAGSCGLHDVLAEDRELAALLARGQRETLAARLEAGARALAALYEYGLLHGFVLVEGADARTGLAVPWADRTDARRLHPLIARARALEVPIEAVRGTPSPFEEPWEGSEILRPSDEGDLYLRDEADQLVDLSRVLRARLAVTLH